MTIETIYSTSVEPDPANAMDVLAFVLSPSAVYAPSGEADEIAAVDQILEPAKLEAIRRWFALRGRSQEN